MKFQNMRWSYFWVAIFLFYFILVSGSAKTEPISATRNSSSPTDENGCGLKGYEAHCILDIMDEHIEATATVNHCHIPLDITFRVIFRYGNGTEQRWQYTFVTTNQNERVLIPGLMLPPQPEALVYLFVRVPQLLFDLHNKSLAAVEASFVAMLANDMWEEAEFLNESVIVDNTKDCFPQRTTDPLLYALGGSILGVLFVGCLVIVVVWCYRRRRLALDELALVSSLETGLPGAQPYQVGSVPKSQENNTISNVPNGKQPDISEAKLQVENEPPAFKFGRLKDEPIDEKREEAVKKLTNTAVVIGNPVLVDKTKVRSNFNKMASRPEESRSKPMEALESVGETFQNLDSVHKFERDGTVTRGKTKNKHAQQSEKQRKEDKTSGRWDSHPLEQSNCDKDVVSCSSTSNGARPKQKIKARISQEKPF